MVTARSLTLSALGYVSLSCLQATADNTVKVSLNPIDIAVTTTWDGWGTSLSWWANVFGDRKDIADALFTRNESVTLEGAKSAIPGLGFNIARYNIGGSSKNVIDDSGTKVAMKLSDNMPDHRFMESFWVDWVSHDTTSSSWNWNADAKQRAMLKLANMRGADVFEAFVSSPPWWMNYNHATAGGEDGRLDNLQDSNYDEFVLYLAAVLAQARKEWEIPFSYLAPFNEPSEKWEFPAKKESCHFSLKTQRTILPLLRKKLNDDGFTSVRIALPDEMSPTSTLSTLSDLSTMPEFRDIVGKVNTHGRDSDGRKLNDIVTQTLAKKLWDSQYSEEDGSGLTMGKAICRDMNEMGVSAFVYWQALDNVGWGLIPSNLDDKSIGTPNLKYYVMAQFSRHIRPGMKILGTTNSTNTVAAFDADKGLMVIVTVNTDDDETVTYDLTLAKTVAGPIKVWRTETNSNGALYKPSTVELSDKRFTAAVPANSVVTFEIAGVGLTNPLRET